jgi:hypothetical protein
MQCKVYRVISSQKMVLVTWMPEPPYRMARESKKPVAKRCVYIFLGPLCVFINDASFVIFCGLFYFVVLTITCPALVCLFHITSPIVSTLCTYAALTSFYQISWHLISWRSNWSQVADQVSEATLLLSPVMEAHSVMRCRGSHIV